MEHTVFIPVIHGVYTASPCALAKSSVDRNSGGPFSPSVYPHRSILLGPSAPSAVVCVGKLSAGEKLTCKALVISSVPVRSSDVTLFLVCGVFLVGSSCGP